MKMWTMSYLIKWIVGARITHGFSNHCQILPPFHRPITLKIIRGISSLFPLSTLYCGYIAAILYIISIGWAITRKNEFDF